MKNISISSFNTYTHCARQWKFNYIDKIRKPTTSPHLIFGSSIHKGIEALSWAMFEKRKFTLSDMNAVFQASWIDLIEKNEIVWNNKPQANKMYNLAMKLNEMYYTKYSNYMPICNGEGRPAIELYFKAPIYKEDGSLDTENQFSGIIDLIAINDSGKLIVYDHKTSSAPYDDFKISSNLQLVLYAHAARHMISTGVFPGLDQKQEDMVCFNTLVKKYQVEPFIKRQTRKIYKKNINMLMQNVRDFIKLRDTEIYLPNYGDHCSNKFVGCDFLEECKVMQNGPKLFG